MVKEQLAQLAQITDAAFQVVQADLSREIARERELRKTLETLVLDQRNRATNLMGKSDAALIAGADVHWRAWVEQRRRLINGELAHCLVAQAQCREAAAKAFGRYQAVLSLEENRLADVKKAAGRRENYTS
ncbi:MAG: hypothetical protein ACJAXK_001649 [Yoonia sp.]|jgi:hypothetical protein